MKTRLTRSASSMFAIAEDALLGMPVVTPEGDQLGVVAEYIGWRTSDKNLFISFDAENRQDHVYLGTPRRLPGKSEPIVVGDAMAVIHADAVRQSEDGRALVVARRSLRPIDALRPEWLPEP